jgi:3-methyladenine DNA glycosylase AlkD
LASAKWQAFLANDISRAPEGINIMLTAAIQDELDTLADPGHAAILQRFFKTGPGEYGEGDRFRGLRVPVLRQLARKYRDLPLAAAVSLLQSTFHEDRLLALLLLIQSYYAGGAALRDEIHRLYLEHRGLVNNWDLVDASAPHLLGHYLRERPKDPLTHLSASRVLWDRRMAIIATFDFIRQGEFDATLRVARLLLSDPEDLIHKAVGWMLREVGKREMAAAEAFLTVHYRQMPRTMLRYAIEKFPEARRQAYLKGTVA